MKTLEREKREAKSETERERGGGREGLGGERDGWTERQRQRQREGWRERGPERWGQRMKEIWRHREKLKRLKPRMPEREAG